MAPFETEAYGTGQTYRLWTVVLGAVRSHVQTLPAARKSFSWPEGHPGHFAYTFLIHILLTSLATEISLSAVTLGIHLCG